MITCPERSRVSSAFKPRRARAPRKLQLRKIVALLCLAGLSLAAAGTLSVGARADEAKPPSSELVKTTVEQEREAEAIARSVMSPFCPGRTVSACPVAGPWREDIRRWVTEGVEPDEIRKRLHDRVPEHNLMGVPPNRLGWVLPVGAGLGMVGALVLILRRLIKSQPEKPSSGGGEPTAPAAPATTEDYEARLDDELETLER
jgi:cytochrome c-type biogenesis protein CcmH/NrfF